MKTKITLITLSLLLINAALFGQCKEWIWPDDKATAEEKYVLHEDLVKSEQFERAIAPHNWLLTNTPDLHLNIYLYGATLYTGLVKKAEDADDEERKNAYLDSLMLMYDLRMKYCGGETNVMNRKVTDAFIYKYKDKSKAPELLELFDKLAETTGKDISTTNLSYYMTVVLMNRAYHKTLTDEEILDRYNKIQEFIDAKIAEGEDKSKLEKIREKGTDDLVKMVTLDCEQVKANLGPKFEQDPNDLTTAKNIFRFMLIGKCTDEPLWLQTGIKIFENGEPDFGLAKNIALKFRKNDDNENAELWFNRALELATDPADKADMYINLGHLDRENGKKTAARDDYRKALSTDPSQKDAYTFIGVMYLNSFSDCAKKVSKVEDYAVYLAAYKMFKMAGNTSQMEAAKSRFPSVSEIFEENKEKGQSITIGCWINETVVLDTRD